MKLLALLICVLHLTTVTVAGGALACTCPDGARVIEWGACGCDGGSHPAAPAPEEAAPEIGCQECGDCGDVEVTAEPGPVPDAVLRAPGCRKDIPALHTGVQPPPCVAVPRDAFRNVDSAPVPAPFPAPARLRPDAADSPPTPLRC